MNKFLALIGICTIAISPSLQASENHQDMVIKDREGVDMSLAYTSVVPYEMTAEELVTNGYVSMYYPNGKEVRYDSSGDLYTFMSYFSDVDVQEFSTSYRVNFNFSTALTGGDSQLHIGSFIVNKGEGDKEDNGDIDVPSETAPTLDKKIDSDEMDLTYTSIINDKNVKSIEDLVTGGYMQMTYPNGKEVMFDDSGDQFTFMSYFIDYQVEEFSTSYRVTFEFSTSISGSDNETQIGSFIIKK